MGTWLSDFAWTRGGVLAKTTGRVIAVDKALIRDVGRFLGYFLCVRFGTATPSTERRIAFMPERPRPWYLIWPIVRRAGFAIVDDPAEAHLVMCFADATNVQVSPPDLPAGARLLNFGCATIAKSAVARAFEAAFGYPLHVDPRSWCGPAVEKSEINAMHDGKIVQCPRPPRQGHVYQRLIANDHGAGLVEDLRTTIVGGTPVCVFVKRRPVGSRFANSNTTVALAKPHEVFTRAEIERIGAFASFMNLDWAGLDILRDRASGALYIVDANKTDLGPPIGLALKDKLKATKVIARAFRAYADDLIAA